MCVCVCVHGLCRLVELLFPTLISACYKNKDNRIILEQEISCQLLVVFIRVSVGACHCAHMSCVGITFNQHQGHDHISVHKKPTLYSTAYETPTHTHVCTHTHTRTHVRTYTCIRTHNCTYVCLYTTAHVPLTLCFVVLNQRIN